MDDMNVELSKKIDERTREKELCAVVIFQAARFHAAIPFRSFACDSLSSR